MEAGIITIVLFVLTGGIVIGLLIGRSIANKAETQGTIYVYRNEPDEQPSLLLEYGVPIDDIISRKRVLFDVNVVR